jgi:hypothetical protein
MVSASKWIRKCGRKVSWSVACYAAPDWPSGLIDELAHPSNRKTMKAFDYIGLPQISKRHETICSGLGLPCLKQWKGTMDKLNSPLRMRMAIHIVSESQPTHNKRINALSLADSIPLGPGASSYSRPSRPQSSLFALLPRPWPETLWKGADPSNVHNLVSHLFFVISVFFCG